MYETFEQLSQSPSQLVLHFETIHKFLSNNSKSLFFCLLLQYTVIRPLPISLVCTFVFRRHRAAHARRQSEWSTWLMCPSLAHVGKGQTLRAVVEEPHGILLSHAERVQTGANLFLQTRSIAQQLSLTVTMPATFAPTKFLAESVRQRVERRTPTDILSNACRSQFEEADEILQSSFDAAGHNDIIPSQNGFVYAVLTAYNEHHGLVVRPDDVWLAILTQFNFFVNANAEALRKQFVSHEGKRELEVRAVGTRYTVDFGHMASALTKEIDKNVLDPVLRAWILPDFTTTTTNDTIVCSVVMMATMKAYFSYRFRLKCGIPRVTLEGEKEDWEKILARLEKLREYGLQAIAWYHLLHPIISQFVKAFDAPHAEENINFWGLVAHRQGGGSGPRYVSGWITAFCLFSEEGRWRGPQFQKVR
jgi:hypothetical protein